MTAEAGPCCTQKPSRSYFAPAVTGPTSPAPARSGTGIVLVCCVRPPACAYRYLTQTACDKLPTWLQHIAVQSTNILGHHTPELRSLRRFGPTPLHCGTAKDVPIRHTCHNYEQAYLTDGLEEGAPLDKKPAVMADAEGPAGDTAPVHGDTPAKTESRETLEEVLRLVRQLHAQGQVSHVPRSVGGEGMGSCFPGRSKSHSSRVAECGSAPKYVAMRCWGLLGVSGLAGCRSPPCGRSLHTELQWGHWPRLGRGGMHPTPGCPHAGRSIYYSELRASRRTTTTV